MDSIFLRFRKLFHIFFVRYCFNSVAVSDKASSTEARLVREHRTECEELHRELNERDAKFEECVEHFQQKIDVRAQNTRTHNPVAESTTFVRFFRKRMS